MKLQQLRYVHQIAKSKLNISAAASELHTSQPAVSKHIQQLEDELGVQIFSRNGKRLTDITEPGQAIINIAERILRETDNIKRVGQDYSNETTGRLVIATTHTQARYVLPQVIQGFHQQYPQVQIDLITGALDYINDLVTSGNADIGIITEDYDIDDALVSLPCYQWNRLIITPNEHPITRLEQVQLNEIAKYPIVTYSYGFSSRSSLDQAFSENNLIPRIVLTSPDSDVIKTYVAAGLGIGIIAQQAYDSEHDTHLSATDASHLFQRSSTRIIIKQGRYLRKYAYDFLQEYSPYLKMDVVSAALRL